MTSIHTNIGAISALQTLRSISSAMQATQNQVSSGLRVGQASDNAAYWSIATTMRSDNMALSAVEDALGLGAAKVDTAYAGMTAVVDVLTEIKSKLVAAHEEGVDRTKIQSEVEQLKQQVVEISKSASFSGVNWLNTKIDNFTAGNAQASVVSSFVRGSDNSVKVEKTLVDLRGISLFNSSGGGILDAGKITPGTMGGMLDFSGEERGGPRTLSFTFSGPLEFIDNSTYIEFKLELDGDNRNVPIPQDGVVSTIRLDRSSVDALNASWNGVISTPAEMAALLNSTLNGVGAKATVTGSTISLASMETTGLRGADMELTDLTSTLTAAETGGLSSASSGSLGYNDWVWSWTNEHPFDRPFEIQEGVVVSFDVDVMGTKYTIEVDHQHVNAELGTTDGVISTRDEWAQVLNSALSASGAGVNAAVGTYDGVPTMLFKLDRSVHPESGTKATMTINNFRHNVTNDRPFGLLEIDITDNKYTVSEYLTAVEEMLHDTTSAAATLGALQSRISLQNEFVSKLSDSIERGIGRLVDADMNEASTRLKALQTQQQLATQSLSIANTNSENIMSLFR